MPHQFFRASAVPVDTNLTQFSVTQSLLISFRKSTANNSVDTNHAPPPPELSKSSVNEIDELELVFKSMD